MVVWMDPWTVLFCQMELCWSLGLLLCKLCRCVCVCSNRTKSRDLRVHAQTTMGVRLRINTRSHKAKWTWNTSLIAFVTADENEHSIQINEVDNDENGQSGRITKSTPRATTQRCLWTLIPRSMHAWVDPYGVKTPEWTQVYTHTWPHMHACTHPNKSPCSPYIHWSVPKSRIYSPIRNWQCKIWVLRDLMHVHEPKSAPWNWLQVNVSFGRIVQRTISGTMSLCCAKEGWTVFGLFVCVLLACIIAFALNACGAINTQIAGNVCFTLAKHGECFGWVGVEIGSKQGGEYSHCSTICMQSTPR